MAKYSDIGEEDWDAPSSFRRRPRNVEMGRSSDSSQMLSSMAHLLIYRGDDGHKGHHIAKEDDLNHPRKAT